MPAVTIADAVRVSDSADTKAVLQADSTTQYFLPPRMTTAQKNAIASPAEGAVVFDTDLNRLEEYTGATWQAAGGGAGASGAPTDATYIVQTANGSLSNEQALSALATGIVKVTTTTGVLSSVAAPSGAIVGDTDSQTLANKILSQLQLIIGGFKAIFTHSNSADRTYTLPNYDGTLATLAGSETFTNKTLTAPTIADFTNMAHDHLDADDGGTLSASAIASGTLVHERGGLEADVSAYNGLVKISAGATSAVTAPSGAIVGTSDTQTLTNKTIDADGTGNVITNIGSSEVKAELITGLTADASPDGAADYVMTYDNSATALKKVLLNNLPSGGISKVVASGTYTPGSAYTTNSTTFVDVDATNVKQTVTLNGGGVTFVTFTFRTNKSTAGNGFFRITDGTNNSNEIPQRFVTNNDNTTTCYAVFDALAAGSTTFKLQYRSSDANNIQIIISLPITWSVAELS